MPKIVEERIDLRGDGRGVASDDIHAAEKLSTNFTVPGKLPLIMQLD